MAVAPFVCARCLDSLGKAYIRRILILCCRELEAREALNNSLLVFSGRPLPNHIMLLLRGEWESECGLTSSASD